MLANREPSAEVRVGQITSELRHLEELSKSGERLVAALAGRLEPLSDPMRGGELPSSPDEVSDNPRVLVRTARIHERVIVINARLASMLDKLDLPIMPIQDTTDKSSGCSPSAPPGPQIIDLIPLSDKVDRQAKLLGILSEALAPCLSSPGNKPIAEKKVQASDVRLAAELLDICRRFDNNNMVLAELAERLEVN